MDWSGTVPTIMPSLQTTEFLTAQPTTGTVIPDLSGQIDRFAQQIQNASAFPQQLHQTVATFPQQIAQQAPVTYTHQQMYQAPATYVTQQIAQPAHIYDPATSHQEYIQEVVQQPMQNPTHILTTDAPATQKKPKKKYQRKRKEPREPRKRSLNSRPRTELEKQAARKRKHPVLPVCSSKCRKKCPEHFTEEHRAQIHDTYWSLILVDRRQWLDSHITACDVKPRPKKTKKKYKRGDDQKRKHNLNYFLPNESKGDNKIVCKTMFLHTLGMRTDGAVTEYIAKKLKTGLPEGTGASNKPIPPITGSKTPCVSIISESKRKIKVKAHDERKLTKEQMELLASLPKRRPRNEEIKRQVRQLKHAMLPPCQKCRKKCSEKIFDGQRSLINSVYWGSSYTERRQWLDEHITMVEIKERKADRLNRAKKKRGRKPKVDKRRKTKSGRRVRGRKVVEDDDTEVEEEPGEYLPLQIKMETLDSDETTDIEENVAMDTETSNLTVITSVELKEEKFGAEVPAISETSHNSKSATPTAEDASDEKKKAILEGRRPKMHLLCYTLPTSTGECIKVCKTMFLHTLGLRTDGTISGFVAQKLAAINGDISNVQDMRGRRTPKKTYDTTKIKAHIYSTFPTMSPQASIRTMWKDFRAQGNKVSYEVYRQVCGLENICFRKPVRKGDGPAKKRIRKPKQKVVMDTTQLGPGEVLNMGMVSVSQHSQVVPQYMTTTTMPAQPQSNQVTFFNMPAADNCAVNFSFNRPQQVQTATPVNYSFNKSATATVAQPITILSSPILEPQQNTAENMVIAREHVTTPASSATGVTGIPATGIASTGIAGTGLAQSVVNYSFNKPPIYVSNPTEVFQYSKPVPQNSVPVNYSFNKTETQTIATDDFNRLAAEQACLLYNNINPTQ